MSCVGQPTDMSLFQLSQTFRHQFTDPRRIEAFGGLGQEIQANNLE